MRFPYVEYVDAGGASRAIKLYRPVLPIYLRGVGRTLRRLGLVDTGSDFTLLPAWIASALGVITDSNAPTRVAGFDGNEVLAQSGRVTFELRRNKTSLRWTATAYFAEQQYVLLGNLGFLEFFTAKFDWAAKSFEILPNDRFVPEN
jgi:hypothetical protein